MNNIRQEEAIRAFVRLGGRELRRRGKGSHRAVRMPNQRLLVVPQGALKIGLLSDLLKSAGITREQFIAVL